MCQLCVDYVDLQHPHCLVAMSAPVSIFFSRLHDHVFGGVCTILHCCFFGGLWGGFWGGLVLGWVGLGGLITFLAGRLY